MPARGTAIISGQVRYGGTCLSFQHPGGRGRWVSVQGEPCRHSEFQARQGYVVRPYLTKCCLVPGGQAVSSVLQCQ